MLSGSFTVGAYERGTMAVIIMNITDAFFILEGGSMSSAYKLEANDTVSDPFQIPPDVASAIGFNQFMLMGQSGDVALSGIIFQADSPTLELSEEDWMNAFNQNFVPLVTIMKEKVKLDSVLIELGLNDDGLVTLPAGSTLVGNLGVGANYEPYKRIMHEGYVKGMFGMFAGANGLTSPFEGSGSVGGTGLVTDTVTANTVIVNGFHIQGAGNGNLSIYDNSMGLVMEINWLPDSNATELYFYGTVHANGFDSV
jgi:hypothetical protein